MGTAQHLTAAQLVAVDIQAGFSAAEAAVMAAIQEAESGGAYGNTADLTNALAGNLAPGSYPGLAYYPTGSAGGGPEISVGPSQINILAHPSVDPLKAEADPLYNAQQAYAISGGGTSFGAWSTYTSGAYKKYLQQTELAAGASAGGGVPGFPFTSGPTPDLPGIPGSGSVIGGITGGVGGLAGDVGNAVAGAIGNLFKPAWPLFVRVALVLVGVVFLVVGLSILARQSEERQDSSAQASSFGSGRSSGKGTVGEAEEAAAA